MIDSSPLFWSFALIAVVIYCAAQAVRDFRSKRYIWAAAGVLAGAAILCVPITTHAVKIDLPGPR